MRRTRGGSVGCVALAQRGARHAVCRGGVAVAALAAVVLGGCGESARTSTAAELRMQRADLVAASRGLAGIERPVMLEVAAAQAAWPALHAGLPAHVTPALRRSIAHAGALAGAIRTPAFMAFAGQLTGPAATIAGRLASFEGLAPRCWAQVAAAASESRGPAATARFRRANAPLYTGCLYDGHYNLSTIGELLLEAYAQLGGATAFGASLPPAEVKALARAYSQAVRLQPKPPEHE